MGNGLTLTPLIAIVLVVIMVVCGRNFRQQWKIQGPNWQLKAWLYGVPAAVSLLALAFVPLGP